MKRTTSIDISMMRKSIRRLSLKPLYVAIAATTLVSCSSKEQVYIANSVDDCERSTDYTKQQCEAAYQKALVEAQRTAPRYTSRHQCEQDFGYSNCTSLSSTNYFIPAMAGFMVGQALNQRRADDGHHNPVFSYSGYGSYRDKLVTADGRVVGRKGQRSAKVDSSTLKPKKAPTRTVSRGGFGSTASAKSSWGGGYRGGWGG